MRPRTQLVPLLFAIALLRPSAAQEPVASPHRQGPLGLEGWTLSHYYPGNHEHYPDTLIVTRHGRPFRRFGGDPLLWSWTFLSHGTQLAYQAGPLHFSMQCILVDLRTGKRLQSVDCAIDHPNQPAWVTALQSAPNSSHQPLLN